MSTRARGRVIIQIPFSFVDAYTRDLFLMSASDIGLISSFNSANVTKQVSLR